MKRYHKSVLPRPFHGIITALVTPFRDDERIDCSAWQTLIDTLIEAGVNGLLAAGSTGEFYTLNFEERTMAMRFCRQAAGSRVPVYANVGCVSTRETVQLALAAQAEGVDAVAVITPYYVKATQAELLEHYTDVCRAVHIPVLAYNFPQHGGTELLPATLGQLAARCENLAGVKDSGGQLEQALAYRDAVPGREFAVLLGPERLLLPALANGCAGVVSGCSNIAPKLFVNLYQAFQEGKMDEAARLQTLGSELAELVSLHTFPGVIKEAMALSGQQVGVCRKPVGPMPPASREKVAHTLAILEKQGLLPATAKASAL
jgi:4-hydroxy-tetrahydrodipicolinate synthase